jgi:hypothetical protein
MLIQLLGVYTHVDAGSAADISDVYAPSISRAEVCTVGEMLYTYTLSKSRGGGFGGFVPLPG